MVDHQQAQERLDAIADECEKHTSEGAYDRAMARHTVADTSMRLDKLGNEAAEIALDACCPFTLFNALGAACMAKSAAAAYRVDASMCETWHDRSHHFTAMRTMWTQYVEKKHE